MKTSLRILTIVLLNAGLTACLPNSGYRDDGIYHYPAGEHTGLPGEDYNPATSSDDVQDDGGDTGGESGGINIGTGAGADGNADDAEDIVPLEFPVAGVGYETSVSVTVQTNRTLKVKFAPRPQESTVAGTGFSPTYGHLGVYIGVGTISQPTALLSNGVVAAAQTGSLINLSSRVPSTCGSNTECRVSVTIKITKPNYDFYCLNYPGGWWDGSQWYYPCNPPGYTHVHKTHPWNGVLYVYTDDTGVPSN